MLRNETEFLKDFIRQCLRGSYRRAFVHFRVWGIYGCTREKFSVHSSTTSFRIPNKARKGRFH